MLSARVEPRLVACIPRHQHKFNAIITILALPLVHREISFQLPDCASLYSLACGPRLREEPLPKSLVAYDDICRDFGVIEKI